MPSELSETNINDYVSTLLKYVIISFHLTHWGAKPLSEPMLEYY